ncbi:MAG: DUF4363 family protein [Oscillospiraceae bacterium]|jgi:hypothetical protein|nr:DUF4363 family protein [Oscillospiraceae bacterium]
MKRIWVALALVLIALGTNMFSYWTMASTAEYFTEKTEKVIELIHKNDLKAAKPTAKEMITEWNERSNHMNMLINHNKTKEIATQLESLKEFLEHDMPADACDRAEVVKRELQMLHEGELPYFYNIL